MMFNRAKEHGGVGILFYLTNKLTTYIHAATYLIIPELKIYKNRSDERSRHLQADHQGNYRGKDLQAADIQVAAVQPNFRYRTNLVLCFE